MVDATAERGDGALCAISIRRPSAIRRAGAPEAERHARETGIDTLDISFVDGSGLSPLNLATPRAFVRWLQFLDQDPTWRRLPRIARLARRRGDAAEAIPGSGYGRRAAPKSGTLTNVSGLSGLRTTTGGNGLRFDPEQRESGKRAAPRAAEETIVGS